MAKLKLIDLDSIHQTNRYGKFQVIKITDIKEDITVRFFETGYVTTVTRSKVLSRKIKDHFKITVKGVGYLGGTKHKVTIDAVHTKKYYAWKGMLERCYCDKFLQKNPKYIGCSVCDEWLNYQKFGDWYDSNYIQGYSLDKDLRVKGNRVYSPETCAFIPQGLNAAISSQKSYKFISPDGKLVKVNNLRHFCRMNNLNPSQMSRLHSGQGKTCKKWTKAI